MYLAFTICRDENKIYLNKILSKFLGKYRFGWWIQFAFLVIVDQFKYPRAD